MKSWLKRLARRHPALYRQTYLIIKRIAKDFARAPPSRLSPAICYCLFSLRQRDTVPAVTPWTLGCPCNQHPCPAAEPIPTPERPWSSPSPSSTAGSIHGGSPWACNSTQTHPHPPLRHLARVMRRPLGLPGPAGTLTQRGTLCAHTQTQWCWQHNLPVVSGRREQGLWQCPGVVSTQTLEIWFQRSSYV